MVFSIISVTTDAILAAAHNHPEREPEPQVFFLRLIDKTICSMNKQLHEIVKTNCKNTEY
jgi:hypothetical protein